MKMKKINNIIFSCLYIFALLGIFLLITPQVFAGYSLKVDVFPNEIDQLEKYVITAQNPDGSPFTGDLQTEYFTCPLGSSTHYSTGCSGPYTNNFSIPASGKAVQDLAIYAYNRGTIPIGKYFIRYKPATAIYDWSNEINILVTPLDMKRYFNLNDGNWSRYNANNLKMNQIVQDATMLDIKNETMCGENTTSMYFSKTSKYAYWNPSYGTNDNPESKITTNDFLIWRPRWNEKGELETKTWDNYRQTSLPGALDVFPAAGLSFNNFSSMSYQRGIDVSSGTALSPYVYAKSQLDLNEYNGPDGNKWYVINENQFPCTPEKQPGETAENYNARMCSTTPNSSQLCFRTMSIMKYYAANVDTPAYKGPVAAVNMREIPKNNGCNTPSDFPSPNCEQVLREDWFMAKDIGLVGFEVKNFGGVYDISSIICSQDPDCQSDGRMANPFVRQQITSYNVRYPQEKYLKITELSTGKKRFNIRINRNDFTDLDLLSTLNQFQLIIDDNANWTDGYGARIMLNVRPWSQWQSTNSANGVYYVYHPEIGGGIYGWQPISINSDYNQTAISSKVHVNGILYDGTDLVASIDIDNNGNLNDKNVYLYLEGQNGQLGLIPKFSLATDSYSGYTFAKIGQNRISSPSPSPTPIPPTNTPTPAPGAINGFVYINNCGNNNCNVCSRPGGQTISVIKDSTTIATCPTDNTGYYSCSVPAGTYTVAVSTNAGETCAWGSKLEPDYCLGTGCSQTLTVASRAVTSGYFTVFPILPFPTPIPPSSTPVAPLPTSENCDLKNKGDANCDSAVNGLDYSLWLNNQCRPGGSQTCSDLRADFDFDNDVDDDDLKIWYNNRK